MNRCLKSVETPSSCLICLFRNSQGWENLQWDIEKYICERIINREMLNSHLQVQKSGCQATFLHPSVTNKEKTSLFLLHRYTVSPKEWVVCYVKKSLSVSACPDTILQVPLFSCTFKITGRRWSSEKDFYAVRNKWAAFITFSKELN